MARAIPPNFFDVMPLKYLILRCVFLVPICSLAWGDAVRSGFLKGNLRIVALKDVQLAVRTHQSSALEIMLNIR
jgi:hypothetical protein